MGKHGQYRSAISGSCGLGGPLLTINGELVLASERHSHVPSDTELLARSRDGDSAAFGALWERHRRAGIVAARGIAPSLDPDDLVSGAYLKIFELVRNGRGPTGAFRPYLYRVISSLAADTYRNAEFSNAQLEDVPDLTEAGPWEDGAFDLNAAARAFESLPERWQAVLWYSEVEGLAPRQIAPVLGLSANGVSALAARAKEGLQSAWVETHIDMQLNDEACRATREQLQRHQLGKLTARRKREVAAHLETCDACAAAAAEFSTLNKQLALVLATICVGGAAAGSLLKSLGVAGVGAAAAAGAAAANGSGSGSASLATGTGAGGGGAGSIGVGTAVIAVAVTAAVAVAAVGGVMLSKVLQSAAPTAPISEHLAPDDDASPNLTDQDQSDTAAEQPAKPTHEQSVAETQSSPVGDSAGDSGEKPSSPPPLVPPTQPTLLAGYQCFIPGIDDGTFELVGHASAPGTIALSMSTVNGAIGLDVSTNASGTWSTGPLPGLDGLVAGTTTARVQLTVGARTSQQQNVTTTQCAGSGLAVDASLEASNVCFADPVNISLSGNLSERGVLFARHVLGATVLPIADPTLDGVQDPTDPDVIWFGIFTGADSSLWWWSGLPLGPYLGSVTDYNAGSTGTLELRVQTPDGRSSTWKQVEQLVSC